MISLGEIEIAEVEGMATCREYSINAEYLSFISQLLFIIIVIIYLFLLLFYNPGFPDQFTRTTTNHQAHRTPCKAIGQVKHRGNNRHAQKKSNPSAKKGNKALPQLDHELKCLLLLLLLLLATACFSNINLS
jgi:hypothetical protein